jgi:hypothetical protein
MKQKTVGVYELGWEQVELVLREDTGGEFYFIPETGKNAIPRIKIGADYGYWKEVVNVVLHEAMEFALSRLGCRYNPSEDISRDHAAYLFSFCHTTYSQACAMVAEFLAACLPDLAREWENWKSDKDQNENEEGSQS